MATPPDATRRYTDREVRVILKSAVELQQRRDHGADVSGGMSLAQLEQVAVEAGVDPELVLRAAAQLDTTASPSSHSAFLGGPTHIVLERVVERSIHPGAFDQLLDVTRGITHEVGEVSTVGRQFGWKGRLDGAKTEVSVSAEDRRTTLRVRGELGATRVRQATTQYTGRARDLIDALATRTHGVAAPGVRLGTESQPLALPNG